MLYKDYIKTLNLADVLHRLELACYHGMPASQYRQLLEEILLAVNPTGKGDFGYHTTKEGK